MLRLVDLTAEDLREGIGFGVGVGDLQRGGVKREQTGEREVVFDRAHGRVKTNRVRTRVGDVGAERGQAIDAGETLERLR